MPRRNNSPLPHFAGDNTADGDDGAGDEPVAPPFRRAPRFAEPPFFDHDPIDDPAAQYRAAINNEIRVHDEAALDAQHQIDALSERTQVALSYQQDARYAAQQADYHRNWQQHVQQTQQQAEGFEKQSKEGKQQAAKYRKWAEEDGQLEQHWRESARTHSSLEEYCHKKAAEHQQLAQEHLRQAEQYEQQAQHAEQKALAASSRVRQLEQLGADGNARAAERYRQRAVDLGWHARDEAARIRGSDAFPAVDHAEESLAHARSRGRAYRLLGEYFDVPPPPPLGGGHHVVVYDHDAIDAGIRELNQIAARAQANLDAARQARLDLRQGATGASADASELALVQVEQINARVLAAVVGALRDLGVANDDMACLDQQNAAAFP